VSLDANLKSIDGRRMWESEFQRCYLSPILSQTDEKIDEARKRILETKRKNSLDRQGFIHALRSCASNIYVMRIHVQE